jgi:hypothetical protein
MGGHLDAAVADFTRAFALPDADTAELRYQRGACWLILGDTTAAMADLRPARDEDHRVEEIDALLAGAGMVAG